MATELLSVIGLAAPPLPKSLKETSSVPVPVKPYWPSTTGRSGHWRRRMLPVNVIVVLPLPVPAAEGQARGVGQGEAPLETLRVTWTGLVPTPGSVIEMALPSAVEKTSGAEFVIFCDVGTLSDGGETLSASVAVVVTDV